VPAVTRKPGRTVTIGPIDRDLLERQLRDMLTGDPSPDTIDGVANMLGHILDACGEDRP